MADFVAQNYGMTPAERQEWIDHNRRWLGSKGLNPDDPAVFKRLDVYEGELMLSPAPSDESS